MNSSLMVRGLVLISAFFIFAAGLSLAEKMDAEMEDWSESGNGIVITNASWADEWVEVTNYGDFPQDLTGWSLKDEQNHTYAFPEGFVLAAEGVVVVHTGVGDDSATDLYMNLGNPIWNNGGDVATLMDADGNVVSQHPQPQEA